MIKVKKITPPATLPPLLKKKESPFFSGRGDYKMYFEWTILKINLHFPKRKQNNDIQK